MSNFLPKNSWKFQQQIGLEKNSKTFYSECGRNIKCNKTSKEYAFASTVNPLEKNTESEKIIDTKEWVEMEESEASEQSDF